MSPLHNQSEHPLSQTTQITSLPSCRPNGLNYTDTHTSCLHYEMCSQGERIGLGQPLTSLLLIYGFNISHASKLLPRSSSLQTLSWSYPGSPFKLRCKAEKSVLNNHNLKHLMTKNVVNTFVCPVSYWTIHYFWQHAVTKHEFSFQFLNLCRHTISKRKRKCFHCSLKGRSVSDLV